MTGIINKIGVAINKKSCITYAELLTGGKKLSSN